MNWITTRCWGLLLALAFCRIAQAGVLTGDGITAYGDSMSMQYSFWVPLSGQYGTPIFYNGKQLNWVDHLVQSGYNFGPPTSILGQNYNSYNVAIAGATTNDLAAMVDSAQANVTTGTVKLVVLNMGANDFGADYSSIYNKFATKNYNPLNDAAVQSLMSNIVGNIKAAVDETLAEKPGAHMVLTTIPDIGITPAYVSGYTNATRRAGITPIVQAVNAEIIALANQHHFPVVDLFNMAKLATSPPKVAGVQLINSGGNAGNNVYLSDKFHPGTAVMGLLANAVLRADNVAYGDPVTYLSDQLIMTRAGQTPNKLTTYYDVAPYVLYSPVPEPATLMLAGMAGFLLLAWSTVRKYRQV